MPVEPVLKGSQHHGTHTLSLSHSLSLSRSLPPSLAPSLPSSLPPSLPPSLPLKPLGLEAHAQFSNSNLADLAARNPTSHATFGTKRTFPN